LIVTREATGMKQSKLIKGRTNIVGITGGVGAGKSRVLGYLEEHCNCRVIFSDQVANDIKKRGYPAYDELVALLGKEILGEDMEIDKAKMAGAIFADENLLEKVNNILHPAVNTFIINIIDEERDRGVLDFVFVEAALLIENGYDRIVDELWYVYADEAVRRQRLKESRGYSDEKIDGILASQLSDGEFRKYADFVIDNGVDFEKTAAMIDQKLGDWRK